MTDTSDFKKSVDIFCKVIDNFGDVGVAFRLARQLSIEHELKVRFIVNNLSVLRKFCPDITVSCDVQRVDGIDILEWSEWSLASHYLHAASLVLETFGCSLPALVVERMQVVKSNWIDIQYLSAEEWVPRFHAIPSVEPQSGLTRTLFFPGFSQSTGGLIRERYLVKERDYFQSSKEEQNIWRAQYSLPKCDADTVDLSLFCYPSAPLEALTETLCHAGATNVRIFLTAGVPINTRERLGNLDPRVELFELPFLSHRDYDRLLWTCNLNFVRGEDSFVRAIWSRRPFIWNIYQQEKHAHIPKLRAFLDTYTKTIGLSSLPSLEKLLFLWNEVGESSFEPFAHLPELTAAAQTFTDNISTHTDLATNLLAFLGGESIKV